MSREKNPGSDDELELSLDKEPRESSRTTMAGGPSVHPLAANCGTQPLLCLRDLRF